MLTACCDVMSLGMGVDVNVVRHPEPCLKTYVCEDTRHIRCHAFTRSTSLASVDKSK